MEDGDYEASYEIGYDFVDVFDICFGLLIGSGMLMISVTC